MVYDPKSRGILEGRMEMARESELLTAMESCRRLGISLDYLYRLLYSQKLPGTKENGVWRIPVSAIEARLRQRKAS